MDAESRRRAIRTRLEQAELPVSAAVLAREFSVSRQIVVGDVALLRAAGLEVIATPRGYVLPPRSSGIRRTLACCHGEAEMEEELNTIVDAGCTVEDVIVDHPVYGQLTGPLHLSSRRDVQQFLDRSRNAAPLSLLTNGIHLHTVICPDEPAFQKVRSVLRQSGILLED